MILRTSLLQTVSKLFQLKYLERVKNYYWLKIFIIGANYDLFVFLYSWVGKTMDIVFNTCDVDRTYNNIFKIPWGG